MQNSLVHSFHIPVMGTAFTIDSPLKIAPYGISSVVSIVDDILIEKMREVYSKKFNLPFQKITDKMDDFRAKRITAYLDLLDKLIHEKFENMKESIYEKGSELEKYMSMLPDRSELKNEFIKRFNSSTLKETLRDWLNDHLQAGRIDVNIMTKVNKTNYKDGEALPIEYNDAHAALRGFAKSEINGSIVLSAGMNPRLYGYLENFDDFYPDKSGHVNKRVILKVSDYRSAMIQGKFLAKKGIWVSEYRIESGLNCGGHAFATDGFLMGPILDEFRKHRTALLNTQWDILVKALSKKGRDIPESVPLMHITAQGGVGTAKEHELMLDHYGLDSVGWGSPFLNVPEVSTVDDETQQQLLDAKEDDLYLSGISPLGVPFNNLRNNSKDRERFERINSGRPGSPCPKKFVALNTELTEKAICMASRQFQSMKIKALEAQALSKAEFKSAYDKIVEKACICVGLGTAAYLNNDIDTKGIGPGVSICPGPNMAYFDKILSLKEMIDHIYGRINIMNRPDRPHLFIKELSLYYDYLKERVAELQENVSEKQTKYIEKFRNNMNEGINYYKSFFGEFEQVYSEKKKDLLDELERYERKLSNLTSNI